MTDQNDTVTHDLPTPGAGPAMRMLDVACIVASTTNPRKTFNQVKLAELAESIKASGVHQPILVRPLPPERLADTFTDRRRGEPLPTHELVAGERRWRGCQLANVAEIPAMIRELNDAQVLEIQIIENLQREDVSELEEAEGYEFLMQKSGLNAEEVGAKIGKSRSYVYARLKLTALCQDARAALRDGKLDASKALLIARIHNEQLQLKALEELTRTNHDGSPTLSAREAARFVQRTFMLRLDAARFNTTDATLCPDAGSCRDCHKRTGAEPELFADVDSADVCTDPPCYHAKEQAHTDRTMREAHARGQHIIDGREAKALMSNSWSNRVDGYLRLDDAADSPTDKPLRTLIGKAMDAAGVQPTLIANPHREGELVAVLLPEQVARLLQAQGHQDVASKIEGAATADAKAQTRAKKAEIAKAYEQDWRNAVLEQSLRAVQAANNGGGTGLSIAVQRHIAAHFAGMCNTDNAKRLCNLLDLGKVAPKQALLDHIAEHPQPEHIILLMVAFRDVEYLPWLEKDNANKGLLLVAKDYGVDVDAVKRKVKDTYKARTTAKSECAPSTLAAQKSASTPPPAAQASSTRDEVSKNGKGKNRPAAPARAIAPKTSKAEASAAIAAALNAADENVQAPAAQGNEAPPVAGAQAAAFDALARAFSEIDEAPAAQDNDVPPVASAQSAPPLANAQPAQSSTPTAHTPGAGAQAPAATHGQNGADPQTGAAMSAGMLSVGVAVKVLPTANGKKQRPWHDYDGTVIAQVGPDAWDVSIQRSKKSAPIVVCFHSSELEVVL